MIILRTAGVLISIGIVYFTTLWYVIIRGEQRAPVEEVEMKKTLGNVAFVVVMVLVALFGLAWAGVIDGSSFIK